MKAPCPPLSAEGSVARAADRIVTLAHDGRAEAELRCDRPGLASDVAEVAAVAAVEDQDDLASGRGARQRDQVVHRDAEGAVGSPA